MDYLMYIFLVFLGSIIGSYFMYILMNRKISKNDTIKNDTEKNDAEETVISPSSHTITKIESEQKDTVSETYVVPFPPDSRLNPELPFAKLKMLHIEEQKTGVEPETIS